MTKKTTLLFDLGGVIVPWVGIEALMQKADLGRGSIIKMLAESDIFNAYETGQCGDEEFASEMIALFDYDLTHSEFYALWNSWVKPPFQNTLATLEKLKETYTLACLSNTNALHWAHLETMFPLNTVFDFSFASHLIHVAKPDPQSYLLPLEIMKVDPENVVFFDDTLENIESSRAIGITSHLIDRTKGVLSTLCKTL